MAHSLIVSSTYQAVEVALAENGIVKNKHSLSKRDTSKLLINYIDILLNTSGLSLKNIDYLTANRGPSPFTTLRVSLTTINGIAFGSSIPVVGVDGLLAFVLEYEHLDPPIFALLNAYSNDAYYALQLPQQSPTMGCKPIRELLADVHKTTISPITVIGNGASFFAQQLSDPQWQKHFIIPEVISHYASIEAIAARGFKQFLDGSIKTNIMPEYLK